MGFWERGRRFCDLEVEAISFLWSAARETPAERLAAATPANSGEGGGPVSISGARGARWWRRLGLERPGTAARRTEQWRREATPATFR
uniref:Uncharacterized protein n=1 Tax=Oryza meridionalis TaxID=40149 RepID=A0A0E0EQ19_9ORYZ